MKLVYKHIYLYFGLAEPLAKKPLGELVEMFGPQLKLPEDFANPDR
jgi:hypothetical protein